MELQTKRSCAPFCDCDFPKSVVYYKGHIPDLIKCSCGEDDVLNAATNQWKWFDNKRETDDTLICGRDVTFHPTFSQGTAIVRGEKALKKGIHYWEMRVITPLAGTDIMFGIGTDKVDLSQFEFHFVSALGTNSQSWGFSYNGKIQHNGLQETYGQRFSQGCLVGVYLDRTLGHLEFFLNRRSLGIAYRNIPTDPNVTIYPMLCSTTAKSVIRLINATSQAECLQLRAFKALSKQPEALEKLRRMPGFRRMLEDYWFLTPPVRYSQRSAENELDIADEAVLSTKTRIVRRRKYQEEEADIEDLYTNAHLISSLHCNESDEEMPSMSEYFDEYFHYLF